MGYPGESLYDLKTTVAFIKWQEEVLMESYEKILYLGDWHPMLLIKICLLLLLIQVQKCLRTLL